jgi:arabinofuranosyltransferase
MTAGSQKTYFWGRIILVFLLLVYLSVVLRNAWICDDAYISLRTVDNFVNGFGLTWNVSERVQAYTHPLWVFLIIPFYAVTGEVYFTVLLISLLFSLATVTWFVFRMARSFGVGLLGITVFTVSAAFVDFSTSGLENPLTFFLLAWFLYLYFTSRPDETALLRMSFVASLGAVNRLDTIIIFAPMLLHVFWSCRNRRAVKAIIIGFLPLIVWELFSLVYYGFLIPNTAYAKLSTGMAKGEVWYQGLQYIVYSLRTDPITVIVILCGIAIPLVSRQRRLIAPAIAVILYLLYTINIGGCFMAGRYLAAPLLVSIALLSQFRNIPTTLVTLWVAMILITGLIAGDSPIYAKKSDEGDPAKIRHGIVRERDWYNPTHGLINYDSSAEEWPSHEWIDVGKQARAGAPAYLAHVAVGMVGFYAGPEAFILDVYAITDPLLARLPVNDNVTTRIGHFGRFVPAGYQRTVIKGQNHISDQYLARYQEKLAILTRGPIFDLTRFAEIIKFNLGWYNHLVDQYNSPHALQVNLEDISRPRKKGIIGFYERNVVYYPHGLAVNLGRVYRSPKFEIGRDHYLGQRFDFVLAGQKIAAGLIPPSPGRPREVSSMIISVPGAAVEQGYDKIVIYPGDGYNGFITISHLRLID